MRPAGVGVLMVVVFATRANAQLPSAVRREALEWTDSTGTVTHAIMWSPMGRTEKLPTLVFSPGYGQVPAAYSVLLSQWASRGFAVIGVEHPAFTGLDPMDFVAVSGSIARQLVRSLSHIVGEQQRVGSPLSRVDPTRIGVIGHSMGGSAAAHACSIEAMCRAAMDLDGTIFGPVVHTGLKQPFFLLRQFVPPPSANDPPKWLEGHDQASLHEDSVWAHSPTMYWLDVQGLDHMSFTDGGLDETNMQEFKGALGFRLPARKAQEMTTRYAVEFFDHYLNNAKRPAILNNTPFPRTTLRRKP